jgi:hypothetical protein
MHPELVVAVTFGMNREAAMIYRAGTSTPSGCQPATPQATLPPRLDRPHRRENAVTIPFASIVLRSHSEQLR